MNGGIKMNTRDGGSAVLVAKSIELAEEIEVIQSILADRIITSDSGDVLLRGWLEVLIEEHRVLVHGVSSGAEF